ncbi:M36 family metallopeptidase [Rubrivirga sp. IMCC45206]|uniref:M36 family metallopeptidase n=1 Tax=Rubrivirga sp. IMCC45206 TaxID=3391614 RepID=UPI0039901C3B
MSRLLRLALLVSLLPIAANAQSPSADAALAHARQAASANGLAGADFVVTDAVRSPRSGADHVYLRQQIAGLEVVGSEALVAVNKGRVAHAVGLDRTVGPAGLAIGATALSAAAAANVVARHNGLGAGAFAIIDRQGGPSRAITLSEGGIAAEPIDVRLVFRATEAGVRLAYEVQLYQADAQHAWLAYVDARTRELIDQVDLVVHDTFGEAAPSLAPVRQPALPVATPSPFVAARSAVGGYRVFAMPDEAPIYSSGRVLVADPDHATASPFGWHDTNGSAGAEYTITRGNNVHAYTDIDANNIPDSGSSPDGGSGLAFDFPLDLGQAPSAYRPASVTNLFYWNNVIHDVMYQYGFDEASGNFQVNNYGRGGAGNDDVRAEAQDGGGTNNANFFTPSDGSRPRMQMYIGTNPAPDVDGSFDNGVVVHEYGHGISNRLTGGPSQSGCLGNAEQMGEGWSDWYALLFTMTPGDARTDSRGIGNYLFGYGATGGGIRLAPYDTDFADNGYTYGNTASMSAVHQIGFVWATILWEVTWDMIDAHGFSADLYNASGTAGNQVMMNLVTEGMKYQPCQPGFVTGRDGILAAEQALYGGAYAETLQAAFARRGLGYSADQGSSTRNSDNAQAFDLWPTGGNQPPTAAFSVSCTGLACQFTDASADADGSIASHAWTFGDGGSSTATNPAHTYGAAGTYTASLTVTDNDGATASTSQSVTVSTGPPPASIDLTVTMTGGRRPKAQLRWSPADGGKVDVFRNGSRIGTTKDDGAWNDRNGSAGDVYQVCETDSGDCSNESTASLMANASAGAADTELRVAPNPVASTARFTFGLDDASDVELAVYNAIGQRVALLASGTMEPGQHEVRFDAGALPSGVYLYRLVADGDVQTGRLVVTR